MKYPCIKAGWELVRKNVLVSGFGGAASGNLHKVTLDLSDRYCQPCVECRGSTTKAMSEKELNEKAERFCSAFCLQNHYFTLFRITCYKSRMSVTIWKIQGTHKKHQMTVLGK